MSFDWYDLSYAVTPVAGLSAPPTPAAGTPPLAPYQISALQQAAVRKHTYCGHHPGAGKTAIGLVATMIHSPAELCVVICPPGLVARQWAKQALFWTGIPWVLADTGEKVRSFFATPHLPARVIIPDSLLQTFPAIPRRIATLVIDEAHRLKTRDANRTRAAFGHAYTPGISSYADRIIAMSGTPMPNNPVELYPWFKASDPAFASRFSDYCARFCPPVDLYVGGAMRTVHTRAINTDVLARHFRSTSLIRPREEHWRSQLPACREEIYDVSVRGIGPPRAIDEVARALERGLDPAKNDDMALSTERRLVGEAKVPAVTDALKVFIDADDAPVVFCWHKSVAAALATALDCPVIHSGVGTDERVRAIDRFVRKEVGAIVCTLASAGTGLDGLQHRSNLLCYVERDYVPSTISQATGRVLRTGQTRPVRVVNFLSNHAIDQAIERILTRKQHIIGCLTA